MSRLLLLAALALGCASAPAPQATPPIAHLERPEAVWLDARCGLIGQRAICYIRVAGRILLIDGALEGGDP